jgi:hypothetical protein
VGHKPYERTVAPDSAHTGHQECLQELRIQAKSYREMSKDAPYVKRTWTTPLAGSNERVSTELKNGGNLSVTYMYFPHPVRPE